MPDIPAVVLSYLETLSRKDLIELMHSFVLTHEDIRLSLEEKSDMENVKKMMQPPNIVCKYCKLIETVRHRKKINLYISLFIGRQDVFALRW